MRMFKAFIIISHFLDLYKEQKKDGKKLHIFIINFLFVIPFDFTLRRSFCEKPLLNTTLHHECTSDV